MNEGDGPAASERSAKSSNTSPPSPTWGSSPTGPPPALTAPERRNVLVPGKEAVPRAPPGLGGAWGYRASRVGEFKESDDWSPLLLLLR